MNIRAEQSADIAPDAKVGDGTSVWHLSQIREGAVIGRDCVVGRGAYIGAGVHMGDACKVQNYALVYEPAWLGHGVFIGPAVVLTNDHFPRAVNSDLTIKDTTDWTPVGVTIKDLKDLPQMAERFVGQTADDGIANDPVATAPTAPVISSVGPAFQNRLVPGDVLAGAGQIEGVESAECCEIRGRERRLGHVEVFRMDCVRTSIIGRPRRLSAQRRAVSWNH